MISLEFHDGSLLRNRYDLLLQLKEHYPNLKVSLFYIPYDYEAEMTQLSLQRKNKLKLLKENLDWIELIPHGVMHIPSEFEKADRKATELSLQAIDEAFKQDGLPYVYTNGGLDRIDEVLNIGFNGSVQYIAQWFKIPSKEENLLVFHGEKRIDEMNKMIEKLKKI